VQRAGNKYNLQDTLAKSSKHRHPQPSRVRNAINGSSSNAARGGIAAAPVSRKPTKNGARHRKFPKGQRHHNH